MKGYAKRHPHSMGEWSRDSKTNVAHMDADDFRSSEKSAVVDKEQSLRIELVGDDGTTTVLRDSVAVLDGEVVDATVMRVGPLREFLTEQIARAKADDVLFSVHLKATMMKVSDPIIFGHVVRAFFPALFTEHAEALANGGRQPQRRARCAAQGRAEAARRRAEGDRGRRRAGHRRTVRGSRWSTPTTASPTSTCRAT